MIPKKIHYCWFGTDEKGELVRKCMASWRKFCPDYEIIEWNESNFDVHCIPYMEEAYKNRKFAHMTDYARLKIAYEVGGVYLDTDVELIKPLDDFLHDKSFFALQRSGEVATGLGFGSEPGAPILKELMSSYEQKHYEANGSFVTETCVDIDKKVFQKHGIKDTNTLQRLDDVVIYPTEYFNPKDCSTGRMQITDKTVSIHHYEGSWHDACEQLIIKKYQEFSCKYEHEDAMAHFRCWYRRNHLRLLLKRYGLIGLIAKVWDKLFRR